MNTQNISSTFSSKSDIILSDIMKKNNLKGDIAEILLTKFTMFFSRGEITEKELIDSIQKEINVPPQTAKQIAVEIKSNLIPTLWDKMPKEERESLLATIKTPTFSDVENNKENLQKERAPATIRPIRPVPSDLKLEEIKKPTTIIKKNRRNNVEIENINKIPKKPIMPTQQTRVPDNYREPIE